MKKIILILLLIFIFWSCSISNSWDKKNQEIVKNEIENEKQTNIKIKEDTSWILLKKDKTIKEEIWEVKNNNFWKYCILDVCLEEKYWKIEDLWDKYLQKDKDDPEIIRWELKKDKSYMKKVLDALMVSDVYYVKKFNNYYIKNHIISSCWGSSIKQEIFNLNWEKIDNNFSNFSSIKIWNYNWYSKLTFTEKWKSLFTDWAKIIKEKKFNSTEEFKKYLEEQVFNKDKKKRYINNKYVIKTQNDIYILYKANFKQPEKIIYLWTDKNWLNKVIDKNWNFLDLALTNKILWYFWENSAKWIVDNSWQRIVKTNKVPIFKVKEFSDNWYYLLYMADWYKTQIFAEMCKPAVYIYDKNFRKNSLNLSFEKSSYFTKIIPEFSSKNTWDFVWKNWKVKVENKIYDYLYYAIKVGNYRHNLDWWIVYWANIEKFFNDKLEKINFNEKEKKDFLKYWLSKYDKNKYYFVSFKYKEDLEKLVKLNFEIKPKKEFRVLLDSYELDYLPKSKKQFLYSKVWDKFDKFLIKKFNRETSDFEVFEWGWVLQKGEIFVIY